MAIMQLTFIPCYKGWLEDEIMVHMPYVSDACGGRTKVKRGIGMYSDGDLCINKDRLDELIAKFEKGEYSTFDFIEEYQGFKAVNKGISGKRSWNASFGRILKQYSLDNPARIKEARADVAIEICGNGTSTSYWEVF